MSTTLAIHGGPKVRDTLFPAHVTVGAEEKARVSEVIDSGILSNYLGAPHENFMGGRYVRECEAAWAESISAAHALAFNSNTSGLIAAMGAIGVGPGDEVIVTAYSMSISAIAPLFYGATPIFADVEPDTFCLDPKSVEAAITDRTKAIIIVDIFGQPFNGPAIRALADKHNLKIVEDCAQAPGGHLNGTPTGLLGDIGVFSLNYHKHIHAGEGGIVVTNDDTLAQRMSMLRNHGECVTGAWGVDDLTNMLGHNMRMTEIEAVIATTQLGKLDGLITERLDRVAYFQEQMRGFEPMTMPKVRDGAKHVYYVHACLWDTTCGTDRNAFVDAVKAELPVFELREKEGVKLGAGYVRPIYLLPTFEKRMALQGPANGLTKSWQNYALGLCPVVEDLHFNSLLSHEFIVPSMERSDIDDVVRAFAKVWDARAHLQTPNAA
ncbi:DegT/DnrJ/EryC1/StrS family aminotransferase [Rhodobacteraceae bacterium N5(2021)]|uniref:DegT/DnrJ/EryC1/StrS family aminotransferase n=1 Tax=Gymnodinialimonas phycosphaerae TaxID=2841589 RepID=A0A975TRE4_9RHOB|nr:DegT/DnrJ/EryC1/StrS family aminotransferase [Gymnodinialimonas phycosphaerae]MBY4893449.1 DegT/DnrJ/EryC1/StrS family aminotransferase [Gymnodinialimonas phycosphaerae]